MIEWIAFFCEDNNFVSEGFQAQLTIIQKRRWKWNRVFKVFCGTKFTYSKVLGPLGGCSFLASSTALFSKSNIGNSLLHFIYVLLETRDSASAVEARSWYSTVPGV